MEEKHEYVTQLGQDRGEVQAPTREQLAEIFQGVDICDHKKPSIFIQSCKDICKVGLDHASELSSVSVLSCLIRALEYETCENGDPRPIASEALKALAVLTSHPILREVLKSVPSPLAGFMALLRSRATHRDIHESAVTVLGNLSACRAHAEAIANLKGLAELSVSFVSPTASPSMQSRSLAMVTNLALSAPAFSLAFADAGGVRAAAVLAAAPSSRLVQPAPQARAAVLLAVLARLPALAAELALAADGAPELAATAAATVAAAAGGSASGDADPAADDVAPLDDITSGVGDEGTDDGGTGEPGAAASLADAASAEPSVGALPVAA